MLAFIVLLIVPLGFSAWIYYAAIKGGESPIIGLSLAATGGPIVTAILLWIGMSIWDHFQDQTGGIPSELELAEKIFADESGGLREGCGIYVFRLTEASKLDLMARGIAKLQNARTGRKMPSRHQYEAWKAMPTDFHVRGQSCIDIPNDISNLIDAALKTAYVTEGYEFDLLVDPVSGIVVYSYDG